MRWQMNVNQVKNVIKKTECADYVFSGLFCSEPIMSKDESGQMVDNYMIFSRTDDGAQISPPQCIFGIYTEKEKTAYIKDSIPSIYKESLYPEQFVDEELMKEARRIYIELFPIVRDMYQCSQDVDSSIVHQYVDALKKMSGNTLFGFYEELFPKFFNWADKL